MKKMKDMEINQTLQNPKSNPVRSFVVLTLCAFLAIAIAVGSKVVGPGDRNRVYAAAESETEEASSAVTDSQIDTDLPSGIAGVVTSVTEAPVSGTKVNRIGTSCEHVIVGQRVKVIENTTADLNVSSSMLSTINDLDSAAISLAENATLMSDEDYDTLLRIVEAEAGDEDIKGRVLVANVIMNRINYSGFPDNVTDVVWQYVNGVPQFSPTYDGRISQVTVSEDTKEAVKQVLEGVDYSEGALFFIQKSAAETQNVSWFEKNLKKLFKYGAHEFYTYPDA
jgi:N-acetylmuramoyl-L-alanine amidase